MKTSPRLLQTCLAFLILFTLPPRVSGDPLSPNELEQLRQELRRVPLVEIPATAAMLIHRSPKPTRRETAIEIVKLATSRTPAVVPAVAAEIVKTSPLLAPVVAEAAIRLNPRFARGIVYSLSSVAPFMADQIAAAASGANPAFEAPTTVPPKPIPAPTRKQDIAGTTEPVLKRISRETITTTKVPIGASSGGPKTFPPDHFAPAPQFLIVEPPKDWYYWHPCRSYGC